MSLHVSIEKHPSFSPYSILFLLGKLQPQYQTSVFPPPPPLPPPVWSCVTQSPSSPLHPHPATCTHYKINPQPGSDVSPLLPSKSSLPVTHTLYRTPPDPHGPHHSQTRMGHQPDPPTRFNLVGFSNFVRTNPRSDHFTVRRFHHIEFWCTDATNAALRFSWGLGMPLVAKSDLSTGNHSHASYILRSADLTFLFSAPYSATLAVPATASIPSFDTSAAAAFSAKHGLAVRAVAVEVSDADLAFRASVSHGAVPSSAPIVLDNRVTVAEVHLYGDVVLRYVSYKDPTLRSDPNPDQWFLPGFEAVPSSFPLDFGLRRLDHAVGNVPDLAAALEYVKGFTGFHEFAEFTAEDVGTSESGLNSVVLACNDETVLLPMNEPVYGTKRKSQIQTYLEHNEGAGVQHLALVSEDIFRTLREMRQRSGIGGLDFMPAPPPTYYRNLKKRAGDVLTDEQIKECEELGILVDRDDQGTLLQIFTKPVGDRPTLFIEIIQRIGCMMKNEEGKEYQKGGCGGFGKGNFAELFKSIEEYEKTLEARQIAEPAAHGAVLLYNGGSC